MAYLSARQSTQAAGEFQGRVVWTTAAACLGWQTFIFACAETDYYRDHFTRYRGDLREIRTVIDHQKKD